MSPLQTPVNTEVCEARAAPATVSPELLEAVELLQQLLADPALLRKLKALANANCTLATTVQ